ncbi:MAG: hypothetical protein JW995_14550 [Melioribacteraceae bacterium]|nr:hypothetical protein [Melioribacteraceae bacterium]
MNKKNIYSITKISGLVFLILIFVSESILSQGRTRWLAVGSLHNWYSEFGCEIEEGLVAEQQYGMRWPAIYSWQDMQAAKAFWIGVKNFTDASQFGGRSWLHKVVHVGPRVNGANEFFPVEFKVVSKFPAPEVAVDGVESTPQTFIENQDMEIDPDLPYDRMIYNVVNTQIGATVKRKIYQFSQEFHDNYIIHEVIIVNTGNVDDDAEIELPGGTLEDLYAYYLFRWAVSANSRYVIGNGSGWGMNTMIDARGDGLKNDPSDENFKSMFAWHGYWPQKQVNYDNIGGPIWVPNTSRGYLTATDTVGRLGSAQFIGQITLHADKSSSDQSNDLTQPSTTSYEDSDHKLTSNNDSFNSANMTEEYDRFISAGHKNPRHAYAVEPSGNFAQQKTDPGLGTSGGFSAAIGYGPYTLAHGDSIRIVWAEAANGLCRDSTVSIGRKFKNGTISDIEKNTWVMTSKDSLMKTYRMLTANFNSGNGFTIPQNPYPPNTFYVVGEGDRIHLTWNHDGQGPAISGFEIYRARGKYDSTYTLIYNAAPDEFEYSDTTAQRGVDYYYYIVSVGDESDNNGGGLTPQNIALKSGRFYTQTFTAANLKRKPGEKLTDMRVVPNPYIISADQNNLLFPARQNRLAFYDIPGKCKIQIFTELGELIREIEHSDGSGDEFWDLNTSSNQLVVSGVYIAVVTDSDRGEKQILKFTVIR